MENDRPVGQERVRLPGYDYPGYDYPAPARRARDDGIRRSRQASTWTAAALIAGVAATTGYLAHTMTASTPGTSNTGTTGTTVGKSGAATQHSPVVGGPVVTSGGSGAGGAGGHDN
jgi:hypothetical protein